MDEALERTRMYSQRLRKIIRNQNGLRHFLDTQPQKAGISIPANFLDNGCCGEIVVEGQGFYLATVAFDDVSTYHLIVAVVHPSPERRA